jgi:hypothetical protein
MQLRDFGGDSRDGGCGQPHCPSILCALVTTRSTLRTRYTQPRPLGDGIDELDIRRQWECDPDETVLPEIAEVASALAVDPEVIRVYRPEQRIVGVRIPSAAQFEKSEPGLDIRGRKLEMVARHVAIGAGAPVRAQPPSSRSKNARCPRTTASHGSPSQSAGSCTDWAPG